MKSQNQYSDCIQYVFENGDEIPDGFYVGIMGLIKKYYNYNGDNFQEIHKYLDENKTTVNPLVLKTIKSYFVKKKQNVVLLIINPNIVYTCLVLVAVLTPVFIILFVMTMK